MSREIKFRAWDKDEHCWIPSKQLAITSDGELITYDEGASDCVKAECFVKDPIEVIFMQYTGLTDKKGVEIYEGDIVNIPFSDLVSGVTRRSCDVIYASYSFMFRDNLYKNLYEPKATSVIEVIGNIYENPELLEVK